MRKYIVTTLLTLTLATSSVYGLNINLSNGNGGLVASAATKGNVKLSNPSIRVDNKTANQTSLDISEVNGADGYKIYRSTSRNGKYKYVGSTSNCDFNDQNVDGSKIYYYKAKAYKNVDDKKVESGYSDNLTVTPACRNTIAKIVKISGNNNGNVDIKSLIENLTKKQVTTKPEVTKPVTKPEVTKPEVTKPVTKPEPTKPVTKPEPTKPVTKPEPTKPQTPTNNYDSSFASQVLKLVNQERVKGGLSELTMSSALVAPANKRAQEIKQVFSHTRPNGTQWSTVLDEFNVSVRTAGENLAYGYNTPESVVEGWMNSPGHRANIMNGNFNKIGVGVYKDSNGTVYCTQLFSN